MDKNLKWCDQIQHLSLQLAGYSGLFYKIRNFLSRQTLRMLYHRLIYSKLKYGILVGALHLKLTFGKEWLD